MITVMFPSGVRVTYNDLNYVFHGNDAETVLADKNPAEGGTKQVFIQKSAGCLVEFVDPCAVTAPPVSTLKRALELVLAEVRRDGIADWEETRLLADLKLQLRRFDARKRVWK